MSIKVFSEALGNYVEVPRLLNSIVSLDPAATEAIFMMGAGRLVKATDAFSYRPPEAKLVPKIGSYTHVDEEELRKYDPDIIFTSTGVQRELSSKLLKSGFNVYPIPVATSVGKILDNVIIIGEIIGKKREARSLYLDMLIKIKSLIGAVKRATKVYVELDLGGPITPGFPTHISDAINILGGINIFDDVDEAYFEPTADQILERGADVIIYEPKRGAKVDEATVIDRLKARGIYTVTSKIRITKGDFLAHMGPTFIIEAMDWMQQAINN